MTVVLVVQESNDMTENDVTRFKIKKIYINLVFQFFYAILMSLCWSVDEQQQ